MNYFITDSKDYQRGRIAAQLDEPFDYNKPLAWRVGYRDEIINPSGGLIPQEEEEKTDETFEPGRPYWNEMETNP